MLPRLIPVTEIKRKATDIIDSLRQERRPLLITEHGREAAILMDVTSYRLQERKIELLKGIIQGQQAISERRVVSHDEAMRRTVKWS